MAVKIGRALTKVITHLLHYLQVCNTDFAEVAAACNLPFKTQNATVDISEQQEKGERRPFPQPATPCKKNQTPSWVFFFAVISSCRIQVAAVRFL